MLKVYKDLKIAPNLVKKCYEFFKLPDIFVILPFKKFTASYSFLSLSFLF